MSRPLRLEFAGALYHVTSRGNERKSIFLNEQDFLLFLEILSKVCKQFNWVIHAYCLIKTKEDIQTFSVRLMHHKNTVGVTIHQ